MYFMIARRIELQIPRHLRREQLPQSHLNSFTGSIMRAGITPPNDERNQHYHHPEQRPGQYTLYEK